jgi:Peptidase family M23
LTSDKQRPIVTRSRTVKRSGDLFPPELELVPELASPQAGRLRAYGWPLRPFDRQHPIYGAFNDPRISRTSKTFHFGIDVGAPDGTPVFAVEPGRVLLHGTRALALHSSVSDRRLAYWHVIPAVSDGQEVAKHQLLGHIQRGAGHVHFGEWTAGAFRNPLRRGSLTPYVDTSSPAISVIGIFRQGRRLRADRVRGTVALIAEAFETPPLPDRGEWRPDIPVTPALLRWRVVRGRRVVVRWQTAVDFRDELLPPEMFNRIYAPGTRKGGRRRPGRYRFYLAREWDSARLSDGLYRLQVAASDIRSNRGVASLPFQIANGERQGRAAINP